MSLNTRARTWWAPGLPLAVGGPSKKTNCSAPRRCSSDRSNTLRSRQRASTRSSSSGKDWSGSTAIAAILGCDVRGLPRDAAGGTLQRMPDEVLAHREERQPMRCGHRRRQWGNITHAQLRACGLSTAAIGRWADTGRLHPVLRGVYAVGHCSPAPEAFWAAALLAYGDDSVLTRHAALALHGLAEEPPHSGPAPQ